MFHVFTIFSHDNNFICGVVCLPMIKLYLPPQSNVGLTRALPNVDLTFASYFDETISLCVLMLYTGIDYSCRANP